VESKLICISTRRVSDHRRAFQPAFRITRISEDLYRSTIGVCVISLGTPQSDGEKSVCTCEYLAVLTTFLAVLATNLGEPAITVE
jgi:hypothetical protein